MRRSRSRCCSRPSRRRPSGHRGRRLPGGASDAEHLPSWVIGSHGQHPRRNPVAGRRRRGDGAARPRPARRVLPLRRGRARLPEVDLPSRRARTRPSASSGGRTCGRDGARVPLPWNGSGSTLSFSPDVATRRPGRPARGLGQPVVQVQRAESGSRLNLVREAISWRRSVWRGAGRAQLGVGARRAGTTSCTAPGRHALRRHHRRPRVAPAGRERGRADLTPLG